MVGYFLKHQIVKCHKKNGYRILAVTDFSIIISRSIAVVTCFLRCHYRYSTGLCIVYINKLPACMIAWTLGTKRSFLSVGLSPKIMLCMPQWGSG